MDQKWGQNDRFLVTFHNWWKSDQFSSKLCIFNVFFGPFRVFTVFVFARFFWSHRTLSMWNESRWKSDFIFLTILKKLKNGLFCHFWWFFGPPNQNQHQFWSFWPNLKKGPKTGFTGIRHLFQKNDTFWSRKSLFLDHFLTPFWTLCVTDRKSAAKVWSLSTFHFCSNWSWTEIITFESQKCHFWVLKLIFLESDLVGWCHFEVLSLWGYGVKECYF